MTREMSTAQIKKARIYKGRGIPTFTLDLRGDGWGQGFGQYDLRWWGIHPLFRIMEVVGVNEWSDLEGEHVMVDHDSTKVYGVGHIIKDRWFYPDKEKGEVSDD